MSGFCSAHKDFKNGCPACESEICSLSEADELILKLSLKFITRTLDRLLYECVDANGKPKAPSKRAIMKARGCLPSTYRMSLVKKIK